MVIIEPIYIYTYIHKVANSVAVFKELSWLTRSMTKVELDRKAAGLRSTHLIGISKLHCKYHMEYMRH